MLLPIRYDGTKYKVSFIDACTIWRIQAILLLKRTKRRIQFSIKKEDILLSLFITICWMMYSMLIWLIKRDNSEDDLQLNILGSILWEIKYSYFTSVVLAFAITVFNRAREHVKLIRAQHTIYVNALYDFERIFEPFLGKMLQEYMPLYTDDCLMGTWRYINPHCEMYSVDNDNSFIFRMHLIIKRAEKIEVLLEENKILYLDDEGKNMLRHYLNSAKTLAYEFTFKEEITFKNFKDLTFELFQILNYLRTPWRCDVRYRLTIINILINYSENDLLNHFYERMLLYEVPRTKNNVTY